MLIKNICYMVIFSLFTFACSSKKQNSNPLPILYLLSQSEKKSVANQQNQISFNLKGLDQYKDTMAYKVSSSEKSSSFVSLNVQTSSWTSLKDKQALALKKNQIVEFALYKEAGKLFELGSILSSKNKDLDISQILSSGSSVGDKTIETFDSFYKSLAKKNAEGKYELSSNFDTFVKDLTTKTKRAEVLNKLKISKTIEEFKKEIGKIKDLVDKIKNTLKGLLQQFITTPKFTYTFDISKKTLTLSFQKKQFNSANLNYKFYYKIAASDIALALAKYKTTGTNLSSGSPIGLTDLVSNQKISVVLVACKDSNFTNNLNIGFFVSPKANKLTDCAVSLPVVKTIIEVANKLPVSELLDFELIRANPTIAKVNYKGKDFSYHYVFLKAPGKVDSYTQLENKWYWNWESHFDRNRKYKLRNNLDTRNWNKQILKVVLVGCNLDFWESDKGKKVQDFLNISTTVTSKNTKKCQVSQEKTFYTTDTRKPSAISGDLKDLSSRYYYGINQKDGSYMETSDFTCKYNNSTTIDFSTNIDSKYNSYENGSATMECKKNTTCRAAFCTPDVIKLKYSKRSLTPRFVASTSGGIQKLYGSFSNLTFKKKYGTKYVPLSDKATSVTSLQKVNIKYDLNSYNWNGQFVVAQCPTQNDFKNLTLLESNGKIVSSSSTCNISNIADMKSYWDVLDKLHN